METTNNNTSSNKHQEKAKKLQKARSLANLLPARWERQSLFGE